MHDVTKPLCIVATKREIIQYTIYCRCLNACSAHVHTLKRNQAKSRKKKIMNKDQSHGPLAMDSKREGRTSPCKSSP